MKKRPSASCIDNFAIKLERKIFISIYHLDFEKFSYFHVGKYKLIEFSIRNKKKIISRD